MQTTAKGLILGSIAFVGTIATTLSSQEHRSTSISQGATVPPVQPSATLPDLRKMRMLDGIQVGRYQGFWNDWKLVTVRFRKDNGEQRFIYANPVAWKAIRSGRSSYPDGAMFGKVAFAVGDDPSFPNSLEPRSFARIQLMRKDSRAYPGTDGWGYALIVNQAPPSQLSDRETATTCHACHGMVPERNYVFSRPSFLDHAAFVTHQPAEFKARFKDQNVAVLTAFERHALSHVLRNESVASLGLIRSASMDLFAGSVNESIGILSRYATEDRKVYALWDARHEQFAIARPLPPSAKCKTKAWVALTAGFGGTIASRASAARVGIMCNGVWQSSGSI